MSDKAKVTSVTVEESVSQSRIVLRDVATAYEGTGKSSLNNPAKMHRVLWDAVYADSPNEQFAMCTLSTNLTLQKIIVIGVGGLASCSVDVRRIFQAALLDNAAAIVLAHNHPSGNPEPSREDIRITRQISEAGKLLNVNVVDHIIMTGCDSYTSLVERGVL